MSSSNEKLKEYCEELKKRHIDNQILLIKGPQVNLNAFELEVAKNRCYYAYPPIGLQYLASALAHRKLDIKILDLNFEFLKKIQEDPSYDYRNWITILDEYLKHNNPSIIGVSNSFAVDIPGLIEILRYLKGKNKIILAGGQNATYEGEKLLNEGLCNFVFQRESENKINFLFDHIFENLNNKPTPGILFKYNGEIVRTEGERDIVRLRGNLIKEHELVPIEKYCKVGTLSPYSRMCGKDKPFATMLLNRGCEGGCRFCGVCDYMGIGVRTREINDALDEIEYLSKQRNIKHFEFLDDDFCRYKDKAMAFLQGIIDRKINISWASNNGFIVRTLDEDLLKKMEETGCLGFKVGIESGNAGILKQIRKPGTQEIFMKFSKEIRKFQKLFVVDYYIIGFPEENFGKIMETFNFSLKMDLDWSSFSVYQPNVNYFGNEEERTKKKDNLIGDFIPTKDLQRGKLSDSEEILSGPNIFRISSEKIPSREQLGQIWFTFNLLRNFILNKNIKPGGDYKKFISWVAPLEDRYPTHPYINFSLMFAYMLIEDKEKSKEQHEKTLKNLNDDYWRKKFEEFDFVGIVENPPQNPEEARRMLNSIIKRYEMRSD